eukprot:TRINITY_DN18926_c0_g1_i13.p1 TRINITY_DN18926_c0_g1~~TRINITY_DN18926_c0_g1_i13.p1  ORF type:complete len:213 (+),score=-23.17 TRINITY_DN18926_c0_g1_i13:534-1172(+)
MSNNIKIQSKSFIQVFFEQYISNRQKYFKFKIYYVHKTLFLGFIQRLKLFTQDLSMFKKKFFRSKSINVRKQNSTDTILYNIKIQILTNANILRIQIANTSNNLNKKQFENFIYYIIWSPFFIYIYMQIQFCNATKMKLPITMQLYLLPTNEYNSMGQIINTKNCNIFYKINSQICCDYFVQYTTKICQMNFTIYLIHPIIFYSKTHRISIM